MKPIDIDNMYPSPQYKLSPQLRSFSISNPCFFYSLKLANPSRFVLFPGIIITSRTPANHEKCNDQVIGIWYYDKKPVCKRHGVCIFKQDFVVNIGTGNEKFVSYTRDDYCGEIVRPIWEFFDIYGERGKFYHKGESWEHHYRDVDNLPSVEELRRIAWEIKQEFR